MKLAKHIERGIKTGNRFLITPISGGFYGELSNNVRNPNNLVGERPIATHLVLEEECDTCEYPFVEDNLYRRCFLVNKAGNIIGHSSVICVDTMFGDIDDYQQIITGIAMDIDGVREDLGELFYHPKVMNISKKNELVIFLEEIYLEPKYIGKGVGTWFLDKTLTNANDDNCKNLTIALMVSPGDISLNTKDTNHVHEYKKRDSEKYKVASEKLIDFYTRAFSEITSSKAFSDCNADIIIDRNIISAAAIIILTLEEKQ